MLGPGIINTGAPGMQQSYARNHWFYCVIKLNQRAQMPQPVKPLAQQTLANSLALGQGRPALVALSPRRWVEVQDT